jgi:hypothetical protein
MMAGETSKTAAAASINWGIIAALWLVLTIALVAINWQRSLALNLGDTDDNMRLMQVRNWLAGQGWFDLRQYRMGPPAGFSMHWSRLVDLPIAGIIVIATPIVGGPIAEALAVALAPLLTMAAAMAAMAIVAARLVGSRAVLLSVVLLIAVSLQALGPTRIDHHGWQLVFTLTMLAGLADRQQRRGGLVTGLAAAAGLAIGLEILPHVVAAAGFVVARWIVDPGQAVRLRSLGLSIGGGTLLAFGAFVAPQSYAIGYCDSLSPVWLSAALAGGGLALLLPFAGRLLLPVRAGVAAIAGAGIAIALLGVWPACAAGPYGNIDAELQRTWLDRIIEAQPLLSRGPASVIGYGVLLAAALGGAAIRWRQAGDRDDRAGWLGYAMFVLASSALVVWQIRAGQLAVVLVIPGAVALLFDLLPRVRAAQARLPAVAGRWILVATMAGLGLLAWKPPFQQQEAAIATKTGGLQCGDAKSLVVLDRFPKSYILAEMDLGPAILVHTRHSVLSGPYHRNTDAVRDTLRFWNGTAATAGAIAARRGVDFVLACQRPLPAKRDNVISEALSAGIAPDWLLPVALPPKSPLRLYRMRPQRTASAPES